MSQCRILLLLGALCAASFSATAHAQYLPVYVRGSFTLGSPLSSSAPYSFSDTFFLESNPGASKTIYLDYDGHHSVNNAWNHDLVFQSFDTDNDPTSFSNSELLEIQRQFQNVVEDFLPFDVNVTTRDPGLSALTRTSFSDTTYGIRMVNTTNISGSGAGGGGTAIINSFNRIDSRDNIAFTFNTGANVGGMTNSHEVGHTLGLAHDGLNGSTYHPGAGSGTTSWGPLMGAPFNANVTQWSNGDYAGSSSTQDDLAIITNAANGINYRNDMVGNTLATANVLQLDTSGNIFDWNIIERNTDVDVFSFVAGAGQLLLNIQPFQGRPNLDILANLFDSSGTLLSSSNPLDGLGATFNLGLAGGQYFLSIEGTGRLGRYSDYGSLGFYSIEGSAAVSAVPEPAAAFGLSLLAIGMLARRQRD